MITGLVSCADPSPAQGHDSVMADTNHSPVKKEAPVHRDQPALGCFYLMGENFVFDGNEARRDAWLNAFTDSIARKGFDPKTTLFENGGGPAGAQWNPVADILVVAWFPEATVPDSAKFRVNGYDVKPKLSGVRKNPDGELHWFVLPQRDLNIQRHLPSAKEIDEISAEKKLDKNSWPQNKVTALNISVTANRQQGEVTMKKYLLVAYE